MMMQRHILGYYYWYPGRVLLLVPGYSEVPGVCIGFLLYREHVYTGTRVPASGRGRLSLSLRVSPGNPDYKAAASGTATSSSTSTTTSNTSSSTGILNSMNLNSMAGYPVPGYTCTRVMTLTMTLMSVSVSRSRCAFACEDSHRVPGYRPVGIRIPTRVTVPVPRAACLCLFLGVHCT
eukprot:3612101-Rhodomonas_salina.1